MQLTNKPCICLIEDTATSKLCYLSWYASLRFASIRPQHIIYFSSPGYVYPHCINSALSVEPKNLPLCDDMRYDPSAIAELNNSLLIINYDQIRISAMAVSLEIFNNYTETNPDSIFSLAYKKSNIGVHIASHLLRFYPALIENFSPESKLVKSLIYQVCCQLLLIERLSEDFTITLALFSESTYLCGALVEFLANIKSKVSYPNFQSPVQISGITKDNCVGKSLLNLAYENQYNHCLHQIDKYKSIISYGRMLLDKRIEDVKFLNAGASPHYQAVLLKILNENGLGPSINNRAQIEVIDSVPIPKFIFYLHCFADGPFLEGYSGFSSSFQYFLFVLNLLGKCMGNSAFKVLVKPHPNLMLGFKSELPCDIEKTNSDLVFTMRLLRRLISSHQHVQIVNPFLQNSLLLNMANTTHVTSHGSIGLEALYIGSPLICTCTAPYSNIGLGEKTLTPADSKLPVGFPGSSCEIESNILTMQERCSLFAGLGNYLNTISLNELASKFTGIAPERLIHNCLQDLNFLPKILSQKEMLLIEKGAEIITKRLESFTKIL